MAERNYRRLDLAKEQLDTAIELFLDEKKFSSAITLAGAAEEIFGQALTNKGGKSALHDSYESMADLHRGIHGEELKKEYFSKENLARDALKHLQNQEGANITLDLEEAACWMLVRAIHNARELGFLFERQADFENWFYENIVGY